MKFRTILAAALFVSAASAGAQSTWTGALGGDWNDPTKWTNGVPNGLGAHAIFGPTPPNAAAAINLESAVELSVLEYANLHGVMLTGAGPLSFAAQPGASSLIQVGAGKPLQILAPVGIQADELIVDVKVADAIPSVEVIGSLEGYGKLLKAGLGTLALSGDTSLHGADIEVSDGTLIASELAASSDSGRFVVTDGARLTLVSASADAVMRKPISIDGGIFDFRGTTTNSTARMSGPLEVRGDAVLTTSQSLANARLDGVLSGPGGVTFRGNLPPGNRTFFTIHGDNTYDGVTVVDVGPRNAGGSVTVFSRTGLGSSVGHTIVRSLLFIEEGSSESFVVEPGGLLTLTPSTTFHEGAVTLVGAILNAAGRERSDRGLTVRMSGDLRLVGGGQIGDSPISFDPFELTGNVTGSGSLVLEGGGPQLYFGDIVHDGDIFLGDRADVELVGRVAPAGDLVLVTTNLQNNRTLIWRSSDEFFEGDVRIRDGRTLVSSDWSVDDLILDPRRQRASLLGATLEVDPTAELTVRGDFKFRGGTIRGSIAGVSEIRKTTIMDGRVARLGSDFHGEVYIDEGRLAVEDSAGLGSAVGSTHITSPDRAVLVLNHGVVVEDDVFLNNARGFFYSGALTGPGFLGLEGPGTLAGDLYLGDEGAYVGGEFIFNNGLPESFGGDVTISGSIHGGNLYKASTSDRTFTLLSGNHTYTGRTEILGGIFKLKDGGRLASTSEIVLRRTTRYENALFIDNQEMVMPDRIDDDLTIRSVGDNLIDLIGNATTSTSETIGQIEVQLGHLRLAVFPWDNPSNSTIRVERLSRQAGTTVNFYLRDPTAHIDLADSVLDDGLLPWGTVTGLGDPEDFATIGPNGITQYSKLYTYESDLNAANATTNVRLTSSTALTREQRINALKIDSTSSVPINVNLGSNTLAIESGGLFLKANVTLENGEITSGNGELIIHNFSNATISADLVDNINQPVAVTFAGSRPTVSFLNRNVFHLTGNNTYTGGTNVIGASDVYVDGADALPERGDLTVSSSRVFFSDANSPWKIGTLRLHGNSLQPTSAESTATIDAEEYLLEFGTVDVSLAGDGRITKIGEGDVTLQRPNPAYAGQIIVEMGTLVVEPNATLGSGPAAEANATLVMPGGALLIVSDQQDELLVLQGGDLILGRFLETPQWFGPIEVRDDSRILSFGKSGGAIAGPISGAGDLSVSGPFDFLDRRIMLSGSLNEFKGNLHITGGTVRLNGVSPDYEGSITVDAALFTVSSSEALGRSRVTVREEGRFAIESSLSANIVLAGGTLAGGAAPIIDGRLQIDGHSIIDTIGDDSSFPGQPTNLTVRSLTTFSSGSRLKKLGRGVVRFEGETHVAGDVELVAYDGRLDVAGNVVADSPATSLNLVGSAAHFSASVNVPMGMTFQLRTNGEPTDFVLDEPSSVLSGGGTIRNNVALSGSAAISPGDSTGRLTIDGNLQLDGAAKYEWELFKFDGDPGVRLGWDVLQVNGDVVFNPNSQPFVIELLATSALASLDADMRQSNISSIQWLILASERLADFSPGDVVVDRASVKLGGQFSVAGDARNLYLVYAVPEPYCALLLAQLSLVLSFSARFKARRETARARVGRPRNRR
jgi:autotransporter-associated beta strand protein